MSGTFANKMIAFLGGFLWLLKPRTFASSPRCALPIFMALVLTASSLFAAPTTIFADETNTVDQPAPTERNSYYQQDAFQIVLGDLDEYPDEKLFVRAKDLGDFPEGTAVNPPKKSKKYLGDELQLTQAQWLDFLSENKDKFLGTDYLGANVAQEWNSGVWWTPSYPSPTGANEMNCAGFVARAMLEAGHEQYDFAYWPAWIDDWYNDRYNPHTAFRLAGPRSFLRQALHPNWNLVVYKYTSAEAMLRSGLLEKGDIIVMIGYTFDDHMGIFWGDNPTNNKFWHSAAGSLYSGGYLIGAIEGKNAITRIGTTDAVADFYLVKWASPENKISATSENEPTNTKGTPQNTKYQNALPALFEEWKDTLFPQLFLSLGI
ncbi:MAG: hypothetical protein LBB42_00040 [Coriobacteriales bacterium]|nr:hypothetical protein [Coriobacteriales bacterium]